MTKGSSDICKAENCHCVIHVQGHIYGRLKSVFVSNCFNFIVVTARKGAVDG